MLGKESIVTLSDNNEYVVVEIMEYQNKKYLYLVDINNHENYMISEVNGKELIEITDEKLLEILLNIAIKNASLTKTEK